MYSQALVAGPLCRAENDPINVFGKSATRLKRSSGWRSGGALLRSAKRPSTGVFSRRIRKAPSLTTTPRPPRHAYGLLDPMVGEESSGMRQPPLWLLAFPRELQSCSAGTQFGLSVLYIARPEMRHSSASRGGSALVKRRRAAIIPAQNPEGCVRLRGSSSLSVEASHGIAWAKLWGTNRRNRNKHVISVFGVCSS